MENERNAPNFGIAPVLGFLAATLQVHPPLFEQNSIK